MFFLLTLGLINSDSIPGLIKFKKRSFNRLLTYCKCLRIDFTSYAEVWLEDYEDDSFEQQMDDIVSITRPFYLQLHAYARHKLRKIYGNLIPTDSSIPMHILGDVLGATLLNVKYFIYYTIMTISNK